MTSSLARTVVAALAMGAAVLGESPAPCVVVLDERGLPVIGGSPALPAFRLVEVLAQHGIAAQVVTADQAAQPEVLNAQRCSVLVMANGNAFPRPAFANLRAFHAGGGCLVMSGVPFTHPCERADGKWLDRGHENAFAHDGKGMGTGGFGGPIAAGKMPRAVVPENALGLRAEMLVSAEGGRQWFDPHAMPREDEVLPLVNYVGSDGEMHPGAVLVRHGCADFRGARDVWIGQLAAENGEADRDLAAQLFVRGVLWCLWEKKELSEAEFRSRLTALDRLGKSPPLPENLAIDDVARPWGETFLPKSKPPARRLLVVNLAGRSAAEILALTCLQGLTSRDEPRLWLIRQELDQLWLERHQQMGHIDGYEAVADWTVLFRQFPSKGAIIPDPQLYRGDLLALNVAACEDAIVAPPELAERLGLAVKVDLRGRFPTYAEGVRWLAKTYRDKLSRHLCEFASPTRLANGSVAYSYQWRGFMFWLCGVDDERKPGADRFAERRAIAEVFATMPPNIPIMGFPFGGEGIGPSEPEGVAFASRYAKGLICSDHLANACVTSGIRIAELQQRPQSPAPALARDKLYVALALSDGDNQNAWFNFFSRYFEHPSFGKFPLAFGVGPAIRELQPAVAQWFYERATPNTEFIADVSGVAYMQPEEWGRAYADRDRVFAGFLDWTARLMPPLGLRAVRPVDGSPETIARYARALPFCHSIFADMGCYAGYRGHAQLTYALRDDRPVFRAATTWRKHDGGFLGELREQAGAQRPAFLNGFVHCWTFGPDDLARIYAERDPDMVFVTPTQLAALYREAREKDWVK